MAIISYIWIWHFQLFATVKATDTIAQFVRLDVIDQWQTFVHRTKTTSTWTVLSRFQDVKSTQGN